MTLNTNASAITIPVRYGAVVNIVTILGLVSLSFALFTPLLALAWVLTLIGLRIAAVCLAGIFITTITPEVTANDLR